MSYFGESSSGLYPGGFGTSMGLGDSIPPNPLSFSAENIGHAPAEQYYQPRRLADPAARANEEDQIAQDEILAFEPDAAALAVPHYGGVDNNGLPGGLDEEQEALVLDEEYEKPNSVLRELGAFSELTVHGMDKVPAPFGDKVHEARNPILEPELTKYLDLEEKFLKVVNSPEAAQFYEPFSRLQKRLDEIWDSEYIIEAKDMHILMHKVDIMLPVYTKQAQNWLLYSEGAKISSPVSIFLIESPIPHAPKKSKTGPWVFKLVVAPGFNLLAAGEPVTVVVRSVPSKYDVKIENETAAAAKQVLPAVTTSKLERGPHDQFSFDSISFSVPSNGKPFQVEFKFSVYMQNKTNYPCVVHSLPFTTLSNVNQWKQGENRYVAYHAFGEMRGPLAEVPYPAFFNALHYEYLTSTRQLGSEGYLRRLKAKHDEAKQHFKKKKIKKDSERSEGHDMAIALYESCINYQRFVRPLTVAEVKSIFPPKIKGAGRGNKGHTEWMEHDTFSRIWRDWYGELAYRLYTGQSFGDEPRRLFLDGLIHIITPNDEPEGILDPAHHPQGTAIIRTSSKPGQFTYNVVVVENGNREVIFKRVEAPGSEYSTALLNEGYIGFLVNINGVIIPKSTIVSKFREAAAANDNPRYRTNIADTVSEEPSENSEYENASSMDDTDTSSVYHSPHPGTFSSQHI